MLVLAASPLFVFAAVGVKLTSRGPILFRQARYGLDGQLISVYKFRSMRVAEDGAGTYKQVTRQDPRVTPFGNFLRRTSIDELPQLLNVLQGSMSLVGPRPHVIAVNEQYRRLIPGYMVRHKIRPGITGWAQVNGYRGGDDLELDDQAHRMRSRNICAAGRSASISASSCAPSCSSFTISARTDALRSVRRLHVPRPTRHQGPRHTRNGFCKRRVGE